VLDTLRLLTTLTQDGYRALEQRTRDIDTRAIAFDREACRGLVAVLGGAADGAPSAYRVAPAG
jgi:hypothetical protein